MTLEELELAVRPNPQLKLTQKTYLLIDCEILGKAWPHLIAIAKLGKRINQDRILSCEQHLGFGSCPACDLKQALEDLEKF